MIKSQLISKLNDKSATIGIVGLGYSDPYIPVFPAMREHNFDLTSVSLSADVINKYDCVVLVTAHDDFDYDMIVKNARLIVDTRGVYTVSIHENVISA